MLFCTVCTIWGSSHRQLCFYLPFFYTCVVAVTRLIMGAHYLSDVAMGGAVGMLTVVIAMAVLDKKIFNHKKTAL